MTTLGFYATDTVEKLFWPEGEEEIIPNSSALMVFTDFTKQKPLVLEADIPAVEAEKMMKKAHVRLKIIVDEQNTFKGLVSTSDLTQQEILKKVSQGYERNDLLVSEFMHPKNSLKALMFNEIEKVSIRSLIETLKEHQSQHCLVMNEEKNKIRGLFSASDLVRKLRLPITIGADATFANIFKEINK